MEVEKYFRCPHCHENISMLLDCSVGGAQSYIEDCQVCCRPIQVTYVSEGGRIVQFNCLGAS